MAKTFFLPLYFLCETLWVSVTLRVPVFEEVI